MCKGLVLGLVVVVVGISGCGGAAAPQAKLFPVKGRVTLNGSPLTGCTLVLIPVTSTPGVDDGYSGVLNDKGEFELASMKGKAGAAAGKYKVTFSMATADPNSDAARQAAMKSMMSGQGGPPAEVKKPYPPEYSQFSTSPKEVEISRESNELLISL